MKLRRSFAHGCVDLVESFSTSYKTAVWRLYVLRTRLVGAIVTVLTGEISTVDHVSSPSERALDDGQTMEFVAHRTSIESS